MHSWEQTIDQIVFFYAAAQDEPLQGTWYPFPDIAKSLSTKRYMIVMPPLQLPQGQYAMGVKWRHENSDMEVPHSPPSEVDGLYCVLVMMYLPNSFHSVLKNQSHTTIAFFPHSIQ